MDTSLKNTLERLKQANNILVTVSRNPSVDQLSSCIALSLLLNKMGKHATAVFSGEVPSTLEFLEPEKTLEKNTDSLRDFIVSLDKSKADKLRYKVEDKVVKIFITPYKTSISEHDLIFDQGDFNVEVVMALGVHEREELDEAIVAHGRILHDATVISVNTQHAGGLGTIDWVDPKSSSLSEMLVTLGTSLKEDVLDSQIANAFLTGIVAETNRFSNDKTSSETMNISSRLLAAGANQQLVASKLQEAAQESSLPANKEEEPTTSDNSQPDSQGTDSDDGSLKVRHHQAEEEPEEQQEKPEDSQEIATEEPTKPEDTQEHTPDITEDNKDQQPKEESTDSSEGPRFLKEPPTHGGTLTANSQPEEFDPAIDPLGVDSHKEPLLSRGQTKKHEESPQDEVTENDQPDDTPRSAEQDTADNKGPQDTGTLADLEKSVGSPHADTSKDTDESESGQSATPDEDQARSAVSDAINSDDQPVLPPLESLNAKDLGMEVSHEEESSEADKQADSTPSSDKTKPAEPGYDNIHIDPNTGEIMFQADHTQDRQEPAEQKQEEKQQGEQPGELSLPDVNDPNSPPPVPPPMMPPFNPPNDQDNG